MITKFVRIATFAVLTALTIGGNCLPSAQAAKTETSTANGGTAPGAKPAAPAAGAKSSVAPAHAATVPVPVTSTTPVPTAAPSQTAPVPTKVDANSVGKEQGFTAHDSQAPLMTADQRNALYFQWIGGFVMITGGIIGFIIYKAMPPKPPANMSLEQASDAYDGPKKEAAETAPANEPKPDAAETTGESSETKESTEAASAPGEAARSDSESKAEDKNNPKTG